MEPQAAVSPVEVAPTEVINDAALKEHPDPLGAAGLTVEAPSQVVLNQITTLNNITAPSCDSNLETSHEGKDDKQHTLEQHVLTPTALEVPRTLTLPAADVKTISKNSFKDVIIEVDGHLFITRVIDSDAAFSKTEASPNVDVTSEEVTTDDSLQRAFRCIDARSENEGNEIESELE